MSKRTRGLQRLADLYGMVERMRSVDLKIASDSVTEASQAIEGERQVQHAQTVYGRAALEQGDRQEWALADSMGERSEARELRVEHLRVARELVREKALDVYRASRLRMEQMQQVVRSVREREAMIEKRRFQAALDDRHLSRKVWMKTQDAAKRPK